MSSSRRRRGGTSLVGRVAAATLTIALATLGSAASSSAASGDGAPDILAMLERDLQGKMTPFLAGRRGSFYLGGRSLAQNSPLTTLWNVRTNETLGFRHPYFRDGRARGIAITCDELTGCGELHAHAGASAKPACVADHAMALWRQLGSLYLLCRAMKLTRQW